MSKNITLFSFFVLFCTHATTTESSPSKMQKKLDVYCDKIGKNQINLSDDITKTLESASEKYDDEFDSDDGMDLVYSFAESMTSLKQDETKTLSAIEKSRTISSEKERADAISSYSTELANIHLQMEAADKTLNEGLLRIRTNTEQKTPRPLIRWELNSETSDQILPGIRYTISKRSDPLLTSS